LRKLNLGGKIPSTIRKQVIKEWLQGIPRNRIAEKNQIGTGTVSVIVDEFRQDSFDFDLLREVAVSLRKENLKVSDFACAMRLRNKMMEWELPEEPVIENFIEQVNVYCFKDEISPETFIKMVHEATSIANQLNSPVVSLPTKILKEQKKLKSYKRRVEMTRNMMETLISNYHLTKRDLADYKNDRPQLIQENRRLKIENETYERDLRAQRETNNQQYIELFEYRYKEMISENELKKLDQGWLPHEQRVSVKELHEIAHEVYHNPVKYIDIIRKIRSSRVQDVAA
jgi:hypothetical protein